MTFNLPKLVISVFLLLLLASPAFASLQDDLAKNIAEQDRLQRLINDAKNQENTLSAQISIFDNQIKLTQLQIGQKQATLDVKEAELASLNSDIGTLGVQIGNIETNLNDITIIAAKRFRVSTAIQEAVPIETIFITGDFQSYSSNINYLEYVQRRDKEIFQQMVETKSSLNVQKTTLQDRETAVQKLRNQIKSDRDSLAQSKLALDGQRSGKAQILKITKNQESNYRNILEEVRSENASIQIALGGGGVVIGPVKAGQIIARQGNTGCSTGTHLHFGLYFNDIAVNPKPYLDSGYVKWPEANPTVTQWYGENYWWYRTYFNGMPGHNGIDMMEYYGAPILAARDGIATLVVDTYACSFTGTRGRGIKIDHGDNTKTIYWHIQ